MLKTEVSEDVKSKLPPPSYGTRYVVKVALIIICSALIFSMVNFTDKAMYERTMADYSAKSASSLPMIVVVTPTYRRSGRIADLTRLANTLKHVKAVHWIIIEDGNVTSPDVMKLLDRALIPHSYLPYKTIPGYPKKGWYQRNMAMQYVRENFYSILNGHKSGVLYFGDDDNSYDIRLFDDYIRKVDSLGAWAVGLVGGTQVEAPRVSEGKLVGFDVKWKPDRKFPIDMAGFAINLKFIMNTTIGFEPECKQLGKGPESCFLEKMGFERRDVQPFVPEVEIDKEIYVWHTKPRTAKYNVTDMASFDTYFAKPEKREIPVNGYLERVIKTR